MFPNHTEKPESLYEKGYDPTVPQIFKEIREMSNPKSMEAAAASSSPRLVYHPGHITGMAAADGSGYHLYFDSTDNTYDGWVLCSSKCFEIGKIAYENKKLVAGFISDQNNGSNTVIGQLFIYP